MKQEQQFCVLCMSNRCVERAARDQGNLNRKLYFGVLTEARIPFHTQAHVLVLSFCSCIPITGFPGLQLLSKPS